MISDKKLNYYIKAFKKLDETGENTFNWAACLLCPFWLGYRKMYVELMLLVSLISGLITYPLALFIHPSEIPSEFTATINIVVCAFPFILFVASVAVCVAFGFYGNRIYKYYVTRQISNGYHLMPEYRTTSVLSAISMLVQLLFFLADIYENTKWQATHKLTESEKEYTEENVVKYLKNGKKNHFYGKFAVLFGCFFEVLGFIALFSLERTSSKAEVLSHSISAQMKSISEQINKAGKTNDTCQDALKIDFPSIENKINEEAIEQDVLN